MGKNETSGAKTSGWHALSTRRACLRSPPPPFEDSRRAHWFASKHFRNPACTFPGPCYPAVQPGKSSAPIGGRAMGWLLLATEGQRMMWLLLATGFTGSLTLVFLARWLHRTLATLPSVIVYF